jgi:hypothetical protein
MSTEKETMTLHRALAELKLLDSRINKGITEIIPVAFHQKGKKIDNRLEVEEFKTTAMGGYQSVVDLIERKKTIKNKIVLANATTNVTVAGKDMTIADAITHKALVSYKKSLVQQLKLRNTQMLAVFNRNNETVATNAQKLAEGYFGKDSSKKPEREDYEKITQPFIEMNEFHLIDPLKVETKIQEIEKEVAEFEADVDAALSVANATTIIEL